jgi:hypothetical protein
VAADSHHPQLVAEEALDLPGDAGTRMRLEVVADGGIEVVDRLHQARVSNLAKVLVVLGGQPIVAHDRPLHGPVARHQGLTCQPTPFRILKKPSQVVVAQMRLSLFAGNFVKERVVRGHHLAYSPA